MIPCLDRTINPPGVMRLVSIGWPVPSTTARPNASARRQLLNLSGPVGWPTHPSCLMPNEI
jgi:hypothetical protein